MITAPVQWILQGIAYLPDALRPGVFFALLIAIVWLLFIRRGIPDLLRAICRASARLVDFVASAAVLPDYVVTSARRRRGGQPGRVALLMAGPACSVFDAAAALYERNEPKAKTTKKLPWKLCLLILGAPAAAWLIMDNASPGDASRHQLAQVYEYWRSIEAWANVNPTRRAGPGEMGIFAVGQVHRAGLVIHVTLSCPGDESCAGVIIARNTYGTQLSSKPLAIDAGATATTALILATASVGHLRGIHIAVKQT